jgi:hypothetical protein
VSDLVERLRGYPGVSMEQLLGDMYGKTYAGLAKKAADRIEELESGSCRFNCVTKKEAFIAGFIRGAYDDGDYEGAYKEWLSKDKECL